MDEDEDTMGCASSQNSPTVSHNCSDPNGTIDSGIGTDICLDVIPTVKDIFPFSELPIPEGDNDEDVIQWTPICATAEKSPSHLEGDDNNRCNNSVDDEITDRYLAEIDEIGQSGASSHHLFEHKDTHDSSQDNCITDDMFDSRFGEIQLSDSSNHSNPGAQDETIHQKTCEFPVSKSESAQEHPLEQPSGVVLGNPNPEHVPFLSADDAAKALLAADNVFQLEQGLRIPDLSSSADNQSVDDRYRVLSSEERGILADIYESLLSGMERDEIKSKLLDHKDLLDVEMTLRTSDMCTVPPFFEHHSNSQDEHQEESIKEVYASLIREGLCHCRYCTADAVKFVVRSSSCLSRIAASIGEVWLIEFLLDQGCHPNPVSCLFHYTPLYLAMVGSQYDVVKLLVQRAPDKLSQPDSVTLLHLIVEFLPDDSFELLKMVLGAHVCDVNAVNELRETALGLAVRSDQIQVVQLLLDNGADPNIPSEGDTPLLHLAAQTGNKEMALALIKGGADVNAFCQEEGETVLHISIYSSQFNYDTHLEMTRLFLENGADPNLKTRDGDPPLVIAAEGNWPKLVELLIGFGAEVNGVGLDEFNALHYAAWSGYIGTVNILLLGGAEPDNLKSCKNTPLALAAHGNHLNCVKSLLKHKVNVDNADNDKDTPMHYLAYNGNVEGIQALLDHGANPDVLNKFNASPLWNAIYMKHSEVVSLLALQNVALDVKSCGNDQFSYDGYNPVPLYDEPRSLLWVAVERHGLDSVTILLQAGYNIWKEGWLLSGEDQGLSEESRAISQHLRALAQKPPPLLFICRQIIRKAACSDLEKTVQQFPIPMTLKDYILLKDLKLQDSSSRISLWDFAYDR